MGHSYVCLEPVRPQKEHRADLQPGLGGNGKRNYMSLFVFPLGSKEPAQNSLEVMTYKR